MVNEALFDGYYDIPFIPKQEEDFNTNCLISYDKTYNYKYKGGEIIHFYIDDQKFDGPKGIWDGLNSDKPFKRGFDIHRFDGAAAIITPDFSLYLDMPRVMQMWNVYRSRAVGCFLSKLGYNIIPNVRWTDENSYDFAFKGLYENQIVAVGTLGCSKSNEDKILLVNGFMEMIKRIKPKKVIIYGSICKELKYVLDYYSVNYIHFPSEISNFYGGKSHGNEK